MVILACMKQLILLIPGILMVVISLTSCNGSSRDTTSNDVAQEVPVTEEVSDIQKSDSLLYEGKTFSSYIDAQHRGTGVISFTLNVNDRLDIWNMDDTKFGDIVLNEDLTYFTLNMPKKIVARAVVPEYDFARFNFDAEDVDTDKDYLIIYVNKEKRKVRKSDLTFSFSPRN